MISIQIGFYANTSQRPILKEIGLILNNKIRKWRNIRSTISRCRALFLFLIIKKNLFLPSVLIWRKTRKRKPWTLSFIEEAWICRTGAIFQRFSVKRRQARSERESESRARGGVKNTTTKTHLYPYAHQDRKTTKNIKYLNWILCKYQSKAYFKRNRIDLKQQDQGMDKHT